MPEISNQSLVAALGVLLTVNGFLLKYIFSAHTKKIDDLQNNCTRVANEVRASVTELSRRVDREVEDLDRDIKNVGSRLAEQISTLSRELFAKIDGDRKEINTGIQAVNSRLDNIFNSSRGPHV